MRRRWARLWITLGFMAAVSGCGGSGRGSFVLLPDPDGKVGAITVTSSGGSQVVDRAWEGVAVAGPAAAPTPPAPIPRERVEAEFGAVLAAEPTGPAHFLLHFRKDSTDLTDASLALLPSVVESIRERGSVDTSVVGHTDTAGSQAHNVALSLARARAVARLLVTRGVDPEILQITSHGEENPLVPTADGVDEPRNRRVEITVR